MVRRVWVLLAVAFVAFGCRSGPPEPSALRVVSLSPSTTEALFALGLGDKVVGRSRYCDFPKEAARLPIVGGYADPNIEAVLGLAPTWVVGARGPAGPTLEEKLRSHGVQTFFPETESLAQIVSMIHSLGDKFGRVEQARAIESTILASREAVRQATKARPKVRTLFLFDVAPIIVAGPGSFADELLNLAGAENVIQEGGMYPTVGMERLLALNPEVIIDGAGDAHGQDSVSRVRTLQELPGFRELSAVSKGHVYVVQGGVALRPGPRIGEGLVVIARAVHGDDLALADQP